MSLLPFSKTSNSELMRLARRQATFRRVFSGSYFGDHFAQPLRLHIWTDGVKVETYVTGLKGETLIVYPGPNLSTASLQSSADLRQACEAVAGGSWPELRRNTEPALGVVVHDAEGLAIFTASEEFATCSTRNRSSLIVRDDPAAVFESSSDLDGQYRLINLVGDERAVIAKVAGRFSPWEEIAAPEGDIKLSFQAAGIELLAIILAFVTPEHRGRPVVLVLYFRAYVLLAHVTAQGLVTHLDVLPTELRDVPSDLCKELAQLVHKTALHNNNGLLHIYQCSDRSASNITNELSHYVQTSKADYAQTLAAVEGHVFDDLQPLLTKCNVRLMQEGMTVRPEILVELLAAQRPSNLTDEHDAEAEIARFATYACENYWPDDADRRERRLTKPVAMLCVASRAMKLVLLLLIGGIGAFMALNVATTLFSKEWGFSPDVIAAAKERETELKADADYLGKWDNGLTPRSQAWSTLDLFVRAIAPSDSILCSQLRYTSGVLESSKATGGGKVGLERRWIVEGYCSEGGLQELRRFQETKSVETLFSEVGSELKQPIFLPAPTRQSSGTLEEESNPEFQTNGPGSRYQYKFRLTLQQDISEQDPLALKSAVEAKPIIKQITL